MNIFGKDLILYPQEPSYKIRSKNFRNYNLDDIDKFYLPESIIQIEGYKNIPPVSFIEDDNRGAIRPEPVCTVDQTDFFLSIKGVGSTVDPYSLEPLNTYSISDL